MKIFIFFLALITSAEAAQFDTVVVENALTPQYCSINTVPYINFQNNLVSSIITPTELGYLDGVSSNIQAQINALQPSGDYITGLHGAVSASGPGNATATLSSTGVSAGSYTNTSLTVGVDGRITAATSGAGSGVYAVTASSPLFSSGGSTPNITCQSASGSQAGCLSSTDWNTFNGKQPAGSYATTDLSNISSPNYVSQILGDSSGVSSADLTNRILFASNGTSQNINYNSPGIVTFNGEISSLQIDTSIGTNQMRILADGTGNQGYTFLPDTQQGSGGIGVVYGAVPIIASAAMNGPIVNLQGGDQAYSGSTGQGGTVQIISGSITGGGTGAAGAVLIQAGSADSGSPGAVAITSGGNNSNAGADISVGSNGYIGGQFQVNMPESIMPAPQILTSGGVITFQSSGIGMSASFVPIQAASTVSTNATTPILAPLGDGQILQLLNEGSNSITIKTGGNVKLPGLTDYVLAQYGTISFIAYSNVWYTTSAVVN